MKASLATFLGAVGFLTVVSPVLRAQLPTGAQVIRGDVTIAQAGNAMTLTQASRNAIVNWQSFNLGANATLRLVQAGADAAMLARVTGGDPSQLLGTLKADGKLFLINPKGILVGQGAMIDTAAFLASTLDVTDSDFLRGGAMTFKGGSAAGVVNLGTITAREGNVLLLAHTVKNAGTIAAAKGTVGLAAGTEVYLASPDAPDFVVKANLSAAASGATGVENSGVIAAVQAQLEAAGGSIYDLAVNQSGVVRATGTATVNGRVLLTAAGGTIGVSGTVTARNADGSGGTILVGGDEHGANAAVANAAHTVVTATGVLDASATKARASAGRAIVWSDEGTRFLGTLRATGAGGGFAEISGRHGLDFRPAKSVQLGADGTLLLDPDALVIGADADSGLGTSGADPFIFTATNEPATLDVTTLQNQLAATNVVLDTSASTGDITFSGAVAWSTDNTLTVKSGNNINLDADIAGGAASKLALYAGRRADAPPESGLPDITGRTNLASDATITVGTLMLGANPDSAPGAGYTPRSPAVSGTAFLDGILHVNTLEADLTNGAGNILAGNGANAIGAFRTIGTGALNFVNVVDGQGGLDVTIDSATAEGPYLQFITPGTLTLKSGSHLDFSSPGTVLLASTGGAFVNEAGAGVFGGNTRFLIYSSTTAATSKGDLAGTEVFNHPYDENDDYSGDSTSRFFFAAPSGSPILTYTADNLSRTYGAANPALSYTTTGWINGVVNDVTGAPSLSTTATQNSGVGAFTIAIGAGSLASSNYDFAFVPGTLTIERAPLTVTANDATRRVNLANPAFGVSYAGFVLGQDASALDGTLAIATTAATSSPVGAYAITPSGLTSSNYAITFVPGTLHVTANASLLITADSFTRTYGAANPTFTATFTGLVGGDDASVVSGLQFSTAATQASGVGAYTITPFGASAAGYDIDYATGTLTIERAPLTISVPNQSRLYGDANNLFANFNGLVNGDTSAVVSGLSLTSAATIFSNVGTYAIAAAGASAANYRITYAPGSLSILPAPLVVTIGDATRRYGDADPAFNYTVSGLKNDDSASLVTVSNLSSLATATAGIGSYGIIGFPWISSPNYTVPSQVTGTLTITPRPLTITANNQTRVYGDANPAFTATFTGLASFDTAATIGTLAFSTQATTASGVGNWGITFSTVSNPNYTITPQFGTLTITPAPLTFDALLDVSRLYGRADPTLVLPAVSGLKNSDTVANLGLQFSGLPAATADVGTYSYSVTSNNSNYTFTAPAAAFRIDPAPITVAITPTGRLYGDANPTSYEFSANGLAFGQTASAVLSIRNPTEVGTDAGIYSLTPVLNTRNYTISAVTGGAFQINPRILTLDLPYYARYYGDYDPAFNLADVIVGGDGIASFDTLASLISGLHTATPTDERTNTGYYRIDPTFSANPNYRYSWTPGYLAIVPRPVEVTVNDGVAFGGNNIPAGFSAAALGVNLVFLDLDHPSNPGTGYSATISNLPWFDLGLGTSNAILYFTTSASNDTQKVGVATALGDVYFPARPNRTTPQAASDPLPTDLPYTTISFTTVNPTTTTVDSPLAALTSGIIYDNGNFIIDPTGAKKDTRFEDVIRYIVPHLSLGGNYVVTKVSNGKLTLKADPVKMEQTLAAEALVAKRKAAEAAFLNGPAADGSVSTPGTFGLTKDEYPLIREAFVNMLYDMVLKGGEDPFLLALTGLASVKDINMVTNDQILFWLADIHTNPAKQAIVLPAMVSYGVKIAGLASAQRSPAQNALVAKMAPFLTDARSDFIDKAVSAQQAWGDLQATSGNLQTLTGTEVPYERFVQTAVAETVTGSLSALNEKTAGLSETDLVNMAGLGGGVAGGVATGMSFASMAAENIASIFPHFEQTLATAAARAGNLAYQAAGGTGQEILGLGGDKIELAARQAAKLARDTYEAVGEASKASSTATGVFAIISVAVTILIDKTVNVAEEQQQKAKFDALLASRDTPVNVSAMTDDTQGRAIMTVGLFKMFGGGK